MQYNNKTNKSNGGHRKKEDSKFKGDGPQGAGGVSPTVAGSCPAGIWKGRPREAVKVMAEDNDLGVIPTEVKAKAKRG